jgi:hypothetical protein
MGPRHRPPEDAATMFPASPRGYPQEAITDSHPSVGVIMSDNNPQAESPLEQVTGEKDEHPEAEERHARSQEDGAPASDDGTDGDGGPRAA